MTRTWPVLITSLLVFFSPAAVNYAAAIRDCIGEQMDCNKNCKTMIPSSGPVERAVQQGCLSNCRNAEWYCARENHFEDERAQQMARAERYWAEQRRRYLNRDWRN